MNLGIRNSTQAQLETGALDLSSHKLEPLGGDGELALYRAHPAEASKSSPSMLVVVPLTQPSPVALRRLRHEYALRDELHGASVVRPVALAQLQGRSALVLEDPGGMPLDRLLGAPMELQRFLRVAIAVTAALGQLHSRGLLHKDIKPANVLVDSTGSRAWLTGFGIASRLPRERQSPEPPELIAGTLAYMAPEQTGRMNRSVDARSDLYSLGATLYQMLTGSLPFSASEPMEWVHCHIARRPAPPAQRRLDVPAMLSAIVMKLLAKTPEERYQTAAGLQRDLQRCLDDWERLHRIQDFPLGAHDAPEQLLIAEKLYGKEREIDTLLEAFERVLKTGTPELVLVAGDPGIGKSSVVNELHKVLVPMRGLFAAGKFDQYKRDIPYATLAQALQSLIRPLLGKSDAELARWREALGEALGRNGALMVPLIPELELLLGPQAPVPELPPADAQRRFQLVVDRLLAVFARPEHPLALFLDDLQWLDAATLDLLEHLATRPHLRYLLLIGAYRDNELTPAHPLMQRLAAIRSAGARVQQIVLAPLAREDVRQLIADSLRCTPEHAEPLAQLVYAKSGGNPFFTIQFLTVLADEGLLAFDHAAICWTWELQRIESKGYTDNVVDLLLTKLRRLPEYTRQILQQLACLGGGATTGTLATVSGAAEPALDEALWEAVRAGLVSRQEATCRFLHDRVQEAAYALIPEGERAAEHLRIGRLLAARTPPAALEEHIFEMVGQLNRAVALITAGEERERLAELNLLAGRRAKTSTAYASALTYLVTGAELLGEDAWQRRYDLLFPLELALAECQFLSGERDGVAARLAALSGHAVSLSDLAAVARLRVELLVTLGRFDEALAVSLDYLHRASIAWPAHPARQEVQQEYARIWGRLDGRPIEALLDLPRMTDPAACGTMDVLTAMEPLARFTDENLFCLVIGRMGNLSLEHGNGDASCLAYALLGAVLGPEFGDYQAAYRFGRLGLDLVEQRGLDRLKARVYMNFGSHVNPWARHVRTSRPFVRRAFDTAQHAGDLTFAVFSRQHLLSNLLASGDPLDEVQREAEAALEFAQQAHFGLVVDRVLPQLQLVRTLRGLTARLGSLDDAGFNEAQFERHLAADPRLSTAVGWYWIRKLQARVLAGDYVEALSAGASAERLLWTSPFFLERTEYHFYAALARAALCDAAPAAERGQHLDALAAHHRQFEEWAANCEENFADRTALVGAELARLDSRDGDAMRLYDRAVHAAHANGFLHNEALGNELAGRFYLSRGFEKIARTYLRDARHAYLAWGADGKVRQLDERYPHLAQQEWASRPAETIAAPVEQLDVGTVVKVSQAVSGEIVPEKLIDMLMCTAIEQAGAERGVLILGSEAQARIAAEATTAGQVVHVRLLDEPASTETLPQSLLRYVLRTRENVILDDAAARSEFAADPYVSARQARSILCLPLINQARLVGVLYLENNLAPRVFLPQRTAVLTILASQAATALDKSRLYRELRDSEERFRTLVEFSFDAYWETDAQHRFTRQEFARGMAVLSTEIGKTRWEVPYLEPDEEAWRAHRATLDAHLPFRDFELARPLAGGGQQYVSVSGLPVFDAAGQFVGYRGVGRDITERKRVEEERRSHLWFLASMDRINRAIQGTSDLERMMSEVLDTVLEIFACDRAWLVYPCDPQARSWRPVMEHTRSEFPGAFALAEELPVTATVAGVFEAALASSVPVAFGPAYEHPVPAPGAERFGVQSQLVMALHSKVDQPYLFGLHQCSRPRVWTAPEQRLFQEIGRRLADALTSLLVFRSLQESEHRLEEAQRIAHVGYWDRDLDSGDTTVSAEACRIFGLHLDDGQTSLTQRHERFRELVHPEDRPRTARAAAAAQSGGPRYDVEYRLVRPGGDVRIVHSRGEVTRDESGRPRRLFGMMQDITELRHAEDELRASEARFRTFVDHATDAFFLLDEQLLVVDVNQQACVGLGYGREELIGMHPRDFDVGLDERSIAQLGARVGAGETVTFETVHQRKDGVVFPVEIRARAFRQGEHQVILSLARDISERKRAEEELQRAHVQLVHMSRVMTTAELTTSIAHEVNQPLGSIMASVGPCLRWLNAQPPDLGSVRGALERIANDAERASQVIHRVRALVRREPPRQEEVDVNQIISEVIALTRDQMHSHGVALQTELAAEIQPVRGDRVQLQQVVLNLIVNAVDAMSAVGDRQRQLVVLSINDDDGGVRVEVRDSGPGVAPHAGQQLFEPFYTTKAHGIGMGLWICRSIIEAHRGRLWVTSNPPQGAAFQFSLPGEAPKQIPANGTRAGRPRKRSDRPEGGG